jgi:exonuclease III
MMVMIEVNLTIPQERVLEGGFSDAMRDVRLRSDGFVWLDYERLGPTFERGDRIGTWRLIEQ